MATIKQLAATPGDTHWVLEAYASGKRRAGIKVIIQRDGWDDEEAGRAAFGLGMAVLRPPLTTYAYGAYSAELARLLDEIEEGERKGHLIPAEFMTPQYRARLRHIAAVAASPKVVKARAERWVRG